MKQNLTDLEFLLQIRNALLERGKDSFLSDQPPVECNTPALGGLRERRGPSATPSFLGSFPQKTKLSRLKSQGFKLKPPLQYWLSEVSGEDKKGRRGFSLVLIHELVPRAGEGSKREQKRLCNALSTDGQWL